MPFKTAAELMRLLAEEFYRSKISLDQLVDSTGIPEDRLALVCRGGWEVLTIKEIAAILTALDLDPLKFRRSAAN